MPPEGYASFHQIQSALSCIFSPLPPMSPPGPCVACLPERASAAILLASPTSAAGRRPSAPASTLSRAAQVPPPVEVGSGHSRHHLGFPESISSHLTFLRCFHCCGVVALQCLPTAR